MDAVLRNILVCMCCCWLPANKIDRQYRWEHPKTSSTNIITLHNSLQVPEKFCVWKKVFIYFIFYIYLKQMGLNLSMNLPMFVYTFQAMWHHRPLKEYSVFVGIRIACTSFSPYTLDITTPIADISVPSRYLHWYLTHSYSFVIFWYVFLPLKSALLATKNVSPSEICKTGMWCSAPSHCKWNKIINFVISVKL